MQMKEIPIPKEMSKSLSGLSDDQKKYYESLLWLINPMGPRGAGRTELMALAFIQHSLLFRIWVRVFDHSPHPYSTQEMVQRIRKIVNKIEGLKLDVDLEKGMLQIKVSHINPNLYKRNPYNAT